jgi:hypothetical protein
MKTGGMKMKIKIRRAAGWFLVPAILVICATAEGTDAVRGPKILTSGNITENGPYAEVGLEFSTWGDFVALVSPTRWKSPLATGGSLSWLNPGAWSENAGRTGRILLGEVAVAGGLAAAFGGGGGGGGGGSGGGTETPSGPADPPADPPPPPPPPAP